jgi:hypothetical protein
VVRSYDPTTKQAIEGRFPESKDAVTTGVGTNKEEVQAFSVPGVTDVGVLKDIAETTYNSIARGEGTIRFSTKHLRDLPDKAGEQRDLTKLRAGDPVSIGFDPFNDDEMRALAPELRERFLVRLGYQPDVARLVATEYERLEQFKRPFYTKEVTLDWSREGGLSVEVEAINFITPKRDDVTAKGGR